jgi:Fe-S oxidoreductase
MKPVLVIIAMLLAFGYAAYRIGFLLRLLALGSRENRFDQPGKRTWSMIKQSVLQFSQFRVSNKDYTFAGIIHIFILLGFIILLPGELEFILGGIITGFNFSFLGEPLFNLFLLSQDVCIFIVILAMILAFFRRLVIHPPQINYHLSGYLILVFISILMLTLLGTNVLRLVDPEEAHFTTIAGEWMPFTIFIKEVMGVDKPYPHLFEALWWIHLLVILFFLDYIPNSKHLHILAAIPANFFRHFPPPLIKLPPVDFGDEEIESLGISKVEDFTWKQLYDGYSCTECGRCTDQCPSNNTGKKLSPRDMILSIKENLMENGRKLLKQPKEKRGEVERLDLLGASIDETELWQCTTCGACANVCPVGNEHLRDIIGMRQYLMMEEGRVPENMTRAIRNLESLSHPFFGATAGWEDWREGLDVPIFEAEKTEYLLWIGCSIIYEQRPQEIARAMVHILQRAGISFGILEVARCTGDPAKQMGNEYLFQELATQNIEEFSSLGVKKIITMCPHCYHGFTHYYPELEARYEVIPHSVFLSRTSVLEQLGIHPSSKTTSKTISFHDPCYLARHNEIVEEPRGVISAIGNLVEMPRNHKASFCCGAGGGHYWADEEGTRINAARAREAFDTGSNIIATACPFCLLMLTEGMKDHTEEQKVYDIAELVYMHMPG